MRMSRDYRNVSVLAFCQALFITGQSMMYILAGLVGASLTEQKALATLPISAIIVATTLTTIPASLLMKRIGRKPGFMLGAGVGVIGALIASYGIWLANFWVFVLGTMTVGIYAAFAQYYRFAAADVAQAHFKSKAISLVLSGGIVAAFSGPFLTNITFDINVIPFLGSFITVAILAATAVLMLSLIDIPRPDVAERASSGRPLHEIIRQPELLVAIFVGMVGYSVMTLLMTATPLAMIAHGFMIHDASFVIQWHLIGMFAPAFFTGSLIERFGVRKIMLIGAFLLTGAIIAALSGELVSNFWLALFALGLGWNFTFIGASYLLTRTYRPEERAKVQALNDFMIFGTVALASLTSGTILHFFDWRTVNLAAIPAIVLAAAAILLLIVRRRRAPA